MTITQARDLVRIALAVGIITRAQAGQYQDAISRQKGYNRDKRIQALMAELGAKISVER